MSLIWTGPGVWRIIYPSAPQPGSNHELDLIRTLKPWLSGAELDPELGPGACPYSAVTMDQATCAQATPGHTSSITAGGGAEGQVTPPKHSTSVQIRIFSFIIFGSDIMKTAHSFCDNVLSPVTSTNGRWFLHHVCTGGPKPSASDVLKTTRRFSF